jgi:REase_AHJR-like
MDFERELSRVAQSYARQGYQVVVHPGAEELPAFAKDFRVELLGKREPGGVLVTVKKNRQEFAAEPDLGRYAEVTGAQPGWRFDFVILEAEDPQARDLRGAEEPTDADLNKVLHNAEQLVGTGYANAAFLLAWAGLEAAMRRRLRVEGEAPGGRTSARGMLNELYSEGILSTEELPELEILFQVRNQVVHGFAAQPSEREAVPFLIALARRLLSESQPAPQTA